MSKPHRLFVGNLPENIVDQELKNEFASYGRVKDVEVKHKRNADEEIINTFAFIQIDIDGQSLRQCLQEFKTEKFKGRFLSVTVARENFLDKLKREREEAAARSGGSAAVAADASSSSGPIELVATRPALPVIPSIKSASAANASGASSSEESSSSSESEDEEPSAQVAQVRRAAAAAPRPPAIPDQEVDEDGNLLLRKRSKAFLTNGRICIDASSGTGAIHVIERNRKEAKKQLGDDKSIEADKKRLESLGKMKDTYNQQKLAIKNALSGVDTVRSNKIVFDAEPAAKTRQTAPTAAATKATSSAGKPLFDEDDEDEDYSNDFRVKEQYQGERGAKLLKLQSRFKNDKRFDMDEKFLEEGEEGDAEQPTNEHEVAENDDDDERKWQYGILESVMGKRIQADPSTEKKNQLPQTMLRYDPTKQDHTKYLAQNKRKAESTANEVKAKKTKKNAADQTADLIDETGPEVSKEQFYKVNQNLNSLTGGGGFSLLSMFGTGNSDEPATVNKNVYRETLLTSNSTQKIIEDMSNPFKYDTSDDEQEVPGGSKKKTAVAAKPAENGKATAGKVAPKKGTTAVWHETFFILDPEDERMKDGLAFFTPVSTEVNELDMENKQKVMRNILKKKVKRSIKSALPHGAKPNKQFRKFVRHL